MLPQVSLQLGNFADILAFQSAHLLELLHNLLLRHLCRSRHCGQTKSLEDCCDVASQDTGPGDRWTAGFISMVLRLALRVSFLLHRASRSSDS